jgi:hypothetical protein
MEPPVLSKRLPDVPSLLVPEERLRKPLTPDFAELAERTKIAPLDVEEPNPLEIDTGPPE